MVVAGLLLAGCGGARGQADEARAQDQPDRGTMILASTTSTQDTGLFEELIPPFEGSSGCTVNLIAVGSGQAIELGRRGEADAVLAHSPGAEQELMESGVAGSRELVMHNDFVIIGPHHDPAGVAGIGAVDALERIAEQEEPFVSRGDDSGTHAKELALWEQAGVEPGGSWYAETGQGMGATLAIAAERDAYTLADRGTYLANQQAGRLPIHVDGGPGLINPYHVIDIDEDAGTRVNHECGDEFSEWITSDEAQRRIGEFGAEEFGQPLFTPDAGRAEEDVLAGD